MLAFAIVLSLTLTVTFTATPVLAATVIDYPVGTIEVVQGETFTLRVRMLWDDLANPGFYLVAIKWDYFGDSSWHFNVVDNRAYFDNDYDNVPDLGVGPIDANLSITDNGTLYSVGVSATAGDWRLGYFNVEITLRASAPDGTAHQVTNNHPIEYTIVQCTELTPDSVYPAALTIKVLPWTGGIVVRGKDNAYNSDATGIPPFVFYVPDNNPPTMTAQLVGDGAFVAAGVVGTCRNGRWNDDSPLNPAPYLDVLFDKAFKWMVPGADNVLWYEGYGVYNDTSGCSMLVDNLTTLGYTVWGDSTEPISSLNLDNVAILVIPQLQLGYGPDGGNPSLLPTADVDAIVDFVEAGGGLLIMDGNDTFGYNYNKVHNKILEALGSDYWFQHDEMLDDVNSWYNNYSPVCDVDSTTAIGSGYVGVTGTENIGLYSICTLAPVPTFSADVTISPDENSAENLVPVTFTVTVHNDGDAWDTYTIDLSDDLGWPELSFLPKIASPKIYPTDDSHVCEYFPDTVEGSGTSYNMYVGWENDPYGTEGWKTRAYLRFDMSSIPSGASVISATLNAKVRYGPGTGYPSYTDDNMLVDVKAVSGDAWLENELTWDNAPAPGTTLDTTMIYDSTTAGTEVWYSWDVASFVTSELAGDDVASFCMLSENKEADNTDCTVWFYTKDESGTTNDPNIEVTYLGLSTTKTVTLGPCQSENFDLGVIIDNDAPYCTRDTLTIEATSAYTETVVGSDTATAHSKGAALALRGVEVVIENQTGGTHQEAELVIGEWQDKRYDPLTFKVIVTNTGVLPDAYILSVEDDAGWMLEVVPPELYIDPGKSDLAVLVVTPLEDAEGCTMDNITVTATGKLANGIGEDTDNAEIEAKATVHIKIKRGVRVEILPCQTQTATPGSELKWVAKIKNLGNVGDTYSLSLAQDVSEGEPWDNVIPEEVYVPLCSWEQAWIAVWVPMDAKTSVTNTITVTATGTGVSDSDSCSAHVLVPGVRVPNAWIKLTVETEVIAIQVWPIASTASNDFGILDEMEENTRGPFTVRNVGNKAVDVTITGSDAKSQPGEPTATWILATDGIVGTDIYGMWFENIVLNKAGDTLVSPLAVGEEYDFNLKMQAPAAITVPARMWTIVTLSAVEAP